MNWLLLLGKSRLTLVLLFSTLALSACEQRPSHDFQDHTGNTGRFSQFQGKWLVINYWATWCKPCIEEIPELNTLAQEQPSRVAVLGVDFDQQQGDQLQQAISKLAIAFPVLLQDPATHFGYPRPTVLPTTIILDPQGNLHRTLLGPQTLQRLQAAMTPAAADAGGKTP